LAASVVRGDLIVGNATPAWARLAKGTQYQTLQGGASDPAWGAVALNQASAVSGILAPANGGTGNGFTAFSGPTTSAKTFTLPDASASVLTTNAAVTVAQGGTGISGGTSGGVPYFSGAAAIAASAALAQYNVLIGGGPGAAPYSLGSLGGSGQVLTSAGAGANPAWAAIPAQTSSLLSATHTDTLAASVVRGDLIVGNATPAWARLAKGTQYQTLQGGASDPAWGAVALNQASAVSGILAPANGGTGLGAVAIDRILYTSAADTFSAAPITVYGRSLIDDNDASVARGTLGLGDLAVQNSDAVAVSTITISASLTLASRTMVQLLGLTPTSAGQCYYCSDCTLTKIVVSTGTAAGNFASAAGGTFQ
jgi:hypothetical protein